MVNKAIDVSFEDLFRDRNDLVFMILRVVRRMRLARNSQGSAVGDEALAQAVFGFLKRRGLAPSALRQAELDVDNASLEQAALELGGASESQSPQAGAQSSALPPGDWPTIESAPRDGTRIMLYDPQRSPPELVARWKHGAWWGDPTPTGRCTIWYEDAETGAETGAGAGGAFVFWRHLPVPGQVAQVAHAAAGDAAAPTPAPNPSPETAENQS